MLSPSLIRPASVVVLSVVLVAGIGSAAAATGGPGSFTVPSTTVPIGGTVVLDGTGWGAPEGGPGNNIITIERPYLSCGSFGCVGGSEIFLEVIIPAYFDDWTYTLEFPVGTVPGEYNICTFFRGESAAGGGYCEAITVEFADVPSARAFATEIEWLAGSGITQGFSDGTFRPLGTVKRDAMAAFLYRFAGSPAFTAPATSPFTDISPSTPFYKEITWLASTGITGGFSDGTYRPQGTINRDAMAAFLYRFAGRPDFTPPATSPFSDVTPSTPFYKEITWLAQTEITGGFSDGSFRAVQAVNRDAMAAFLFRFDSKGLLPG